MALVDVPWLLLQLSDSAFPTGGFAHAGGLEAAAQHGAFRDADDLAAHLGDLVAQAGHGSLPAAGAAWDADGIEVLAEVDRVVDALTVSAVANRASRAQGQAWLHAAAGLSPAVADLKSEVRVRRLPAHAAPMTGAIARRLGLGRDDALRLALFSQVRGLVSAAVRLSLIGPLEAQAIQLRLAPAMDAALAEGRTLGLDGIATSHPLAELWQGQQDRLYSRLFSS